MVKSGQALAGAIVTKDATGALATPTVGPAGTLYVDGVADAAIVTITGSNPYKWAVTLPTLTAGQHVQVYITATVGVATGAFVFGDVTEWAGRVDANVTMWMGEEPAGLDGLGRLPVGTLHEIDLDSFSGSTVVASSAGDVRNYLVGLVVFLEYEAAPP